MKVETDSMSAVNLTSGDTSVFRLYRKDANSDMPIGFGYYRPKTNVISVSCSLNDLFNLQELIHKLNLTPCP